MGGRGGSGQAGEVRQWTLNGVGRLKSGNEGVDHPGMTVAQEYRMKEIEGKYSENDYERARNAGFSSPAAYQRSITESIGKKGQLNAIQTSEGYLDEGFHRYAALRQLGRSTVKVKKY